MTITRDEQLCRRSRSHEPGAEPAAGAARPAHPRAVLAVILVSYFMILLDNSVIFTALPTIADAMHLSATGLSWVQDAYTLVFGGLLLLGARLGDLLGRRRGFVAGLATFAVASLLIGLAPSGWLLIAARALQGVGAAIVAPSSLSLLTASFPEGRERSRAVAWYGATAGIGASLGLVVGGLVTTTISWRAGFFLNVPIGAAMIVLAPRFLPETPRARGRFDVVGALTATLGTGALVYGIISSTESGWGSATTITALATAAVLLAALVVNESRVTQPIMPLALFADRVRTGAYLTRLFYLGAMIGFFYFTTQLLQGVFGFTALQAGIGFFPMTVVNFAVAMSIPRLGRRVPTAVLLTAGVLLTLAGMAWLSRVGADSSYLAAVAMPMVLIGAGQGLAFAPMTSAGIHGVTARQAGAASGLVNTAHQLGMALGLAVMVAVSAKVGTGLPNEAALAAHVSTALDVASCLLALSLLATLALIVPATYAGRARYDAGRRPRAQTAPGGQARTGESHEGAGA